jgi:hypothetical protein
LNLCPFFETIRMASLDSQFIWSLELDNQLMELIEQFPCLYNRNDEYFKVPRKRNDAIAEIGRILECGKSLYIKWNYQA